MASIFTYDPDPPRISSPWSTPGTSTPRSDAARGKAIAQLSPRSAMAASVTQESDDVDLPLMRLEAEPQEGPTEYKLHLLLRPRRIFAAMSSGRSKSGLHRSITAAGALRTMSESHLARPSLPCPAPSQTRQHRLEQLTTQLLWRLQQSSPHHSAAPNRVILPIFPEDADKLGVPSRVGKLTPGLEESKGALYEIGVSDDGTLVGLAEDEMEESLNNLRAMAACLGCTVDVVRMIPVGDCEWLEETMISGKPQGKLCTGKLWVAEAMVKPEFHVTEANILHPSSPGSEMASSRAGDTTASVAGLTSADPGRPHSPIEQLRISLTGATTSGKSSLLGTLTTATLDNGRGKSRLSLLKHRHEIVSGMTSSVTQELIGYADDPPANHHSIGSARVVNYASENMSSWIDIHSAAENGRLVFLSDSAGHPRYRRTTVRGLMGWAPHWTLLCIPADNVEDTSGRNGSTPSAQEMLGFVANELDLSEAHLDLCLKLELPLAVVITKLDLASKSGLRSALSKALSKLKAAGRKPMIISDTRNASYQPTLDTVAAEDRADVKSRLEPLKDDMLGIVPIVLTSAVNGTGITKLHALLRELPIPPPVSPIESIDGEAPASPLFYVEDVYNSRLNGNDEKQASVISGHLRYGQICVGDELVLGPYATDVLSDVSDSSPSHKERISLPTSRSFPGALHKSASLSSHAAAPGHEWRRVRVASIRNLRLPVRCLQAGQVGTVEIVPLVEPILTPGLARVRKGMVLAGDAPVARRGFVARFEDGGVRGLPIGSAVVIYIASVRASAKVLAVAVEQESGTQDASRSTGHSTDDDDVFDFGFEDDDGAAGRTGSDGAATLVTLQFIASREYVELGAKVLLMPGGGPGLYGGNERGEKGVAGLEGFVGKVMEGFG